MMGQIVEVVGMRCDGYTHGISRCKKVERGTLELLTSCGWRVTASGSPYTEDVETLCPSCAKIAERDERERQCTLDG